MGVPKLMGAVAVAVGVAIGAADGASAAGECALGTEYPVASVAPYQTEEVAGFAAASRTRLRGAELRVPAQPGLTQEWLERSVKSEIAAGDCQLGTQDVKVEVVSEGDGFAVRLAASDERTAKELLRRAGELGMR